MMMMNSAACLFRWADLGLDGWLLAAESSAVIWLRLAHLSRWDAAAMAESRLMVDEKIAATLELQWQALLGKLGGQPHLAAQRSLAHYRRAVTANRRRLSR